MLCFLICIRLRFLSFLFYFIFLFFFFAFPFPVELLDWFPVTPSGAFLFVFFYFLSKPIRLPMRLSFSCSSNASSSMGHKSKGIFQMHYIISEYFDINELVKYLVGLLLNYIHQEKNLRLNWVWKFKSFLIFGRFYVYVSCIHYYYYLMHHLAGKIA